MDNNVQERLERWLEPEESTPTEPTEEVAEEVADEVESIEEDIEIAEEEETAVIEADSSEDAEEEIQTLEDLALALDKPLDDVLATIRGKIKVDGEESEVSLQELRNGYQREADYRRKTQSLAEERRKFETFQAEKQKEFTDRLVQADSIIQELESNLLGEFQNINWKDLEENDREEWLIQRQKYQDRYNSINQAKQKLQQDAQVLAQENQKKYETQRNDMIAKEAQLLQSAIPEWSNQEHAQKEMGEVVDYLHALGFQPNETNDLIDHRAWVIAHKAYLFDKGQEKIDIAKKKVKKLPKIQKPGKPPTSSDLLNRRTTKGRERLKKTGRVEDAAKLFENFL